jgi:hypothetical protein
VSREQIACTLASSACVCACVRACVCVCVCVHQSPDKKVLDFVSARVARRAGLQLEVCVQLHGFLIHQITRVFLANGLRRTRLQKSAVHK